MSRQFLKKKFSLVTQDELERFLEDLKNDELDDPDWPDGFEESTKITYRRVTKEFFKWLHPENIGFVSWIKTGNYSSTVTPDDILLTQELDWFREQCISSRDKTMFETLYETAARPEEFLSARKSDITFDPNPQEPVNFHIVKGKVNGKPRDIPIYEQAKPLLRRWIFQDHPLKNDTDFPLWVDMSRNTNKDSIGVEGLERFLDRLQNAVREAHPEFHKRVTPYTLRHSRMTEWARLGLNEAGLCQIGGWNMGSKMPAIYIHLSKRDIGPMVEKVLGIKRDDKPPELRRLPRICERCQATNTFDAKICITCGVAFDAKVALALMKEKKEQQKKEEERDLRMDKIERDMKRGKAFNSSLFDLFDKDDDPVFKKKLRQMVEDAIDGIDEN